MTDLFNYNICSGTVLEDTCDSSCDTGGVVFGYDKEKIYIWASQKGKHFCQSIATL